jgi:hypothetical protein
MQARRRDPPPGVRAGIDLHGSVLVNATGAVTEPGDVAKAPPGRTRDEPAARPGGPGTRRSAAEASGSPRRGREGVGSDADPFFASVGSHLFG